MKITVGADPEFFVRERRHFISGHIFPCGTKQHPMRTKHGAIQVDGIALECNVTPASSRSEFIDSVRGVISDLTGVVRKRRPDAEIVARPSIFFGYKRLSTLPLENARLGCDPDYCAYTTRPNNPPDSDQPFRTGAGHIHVGFTKAADVTDFDHFDLCAKVARNMDFHLGLPSLLWDYDDRRRSLYGQAGAFRPKSYGMEYRVLSNAWLADDRRLGWVFDRTVQAATEALAEKGLERQYGEAARTIINNNDHDWADQHRYRGIAEAVL